MSFSREIIGDCACPACVKQGKDSTGNHLILFDNGSAFCNRCGYKEVAETYTKPSTNIKGDKTPEEVAKELSWIRDNSVVAGLADRKLKQFACKKYGLRVGLSNQDGVTPVCTYLPISNGVEEQGYKVKSPDKDMYAKGNGRDAHFFGAHVVPPKGNKLFVTEGQEDCIALYQTLYQHTDEKWQNRIAVVSLQNGAGSAAKEFVRNADLVRGYKTVVLCFDMDEAGRDAVDKVLTILPRDKVKVAKYPLKDANDMVKAGEDKELFFATAVNADPPRPEKIICGVSVEDMLKPLKAGVSTPYPRLNEMLRGVRYGDGGGELTVVCAGAGMGKTTLAREVMYKLNKVDHLNLSHIYLEEQVRKTGQSYIALDNNVPLAALRSNPDIIPRDSFMHSASELVNNDRCYFLDHFGSMSSNELMDHLYYFSQVAGSNVILLDHITMVASGNESSSEGERKDLDILMTKLAAFTENSGTSVWAIVHLKRPQNGSFNDGMQISLSHLRGSAAIEQLSHNIIAVEGNQSGTDPYARQIRVLKNREWGDTGVADQLIYNPETGRLLPNEIEIVRGITG